MLWTRSKAIVDPGIVRVLIGIEHYWVSKWLWTFPVEREVHWMKVISCKYGIG